MAFRPYVLFSFYGNADKNGLEKLTDEQLQRITKDNYADSEFDLGPTAKCAIFLAYEKPGIDVQIQLLCNLDKTSKYYENDTNTLNTYPEKLEKLLTHLKLTNVIVAETAVAEDVNPMDFAGLHKLLTQSMEEHNQKYKEDGKDWIPVMCFSAGTGMMSVVQALKCTLYEKIYFIAWGQHNAKPDFHKFNQEEYFGDAMKAHIRPTALDEKKSTRRIGYQSDSQLSKAVARAKKLARDSGAILILGETGAGKEEMARYIHEQFCEYLSSKANFRPPKEKFVAVNCGMFTDVTMAKSELFGHVEGAFTDAKYSRDGAVKLAGNGTLFLDEVGELSHEMQVALLRFLNDKTYSILGSDKTEKGECRIVAATNRNLLEMVTNGQFQKDLYYRLIGAGFVKLPSFSQLDLDTCLNIVTEICAQVEIQHKLSRCGFTNEYIRTIRTYPMPGNIRQLKSVIRMSRLEIDDNASKIPLELLVNNILATTGERVDTPMEKKLKPVTRIIAAEIDVFIKQIDESAIQLNDMERETLEGKRFDLYLLNKKIEGRIFSIVKDEFYLSSDKKVGYCFFEKNKEAHERRHKGQKPFNQTPPDENRVGTSMKLFDEAARKIR